MKIILIFIVIMSLNLFARMNPFEPTDTFNEKKTEYYKLQDEIKAKKIKDKKAEELAIKQLQQERIAKQIEQKRITKQIEQIKKDINEIFQLLPFVKIEIINDILTITVDKKYKLLNQDILKAEKKFIFDFQGNVSFYTIRKDIKNKNFKSFAIGTHRKKNFFRIVIDLSDSMIKYKEIINNKKGMITIQKG